MTTFTWGTEKWTRPPMCLAEMEETIAQTIVSDLTERKLGLVEGDDGSMYAIEVKVTFLRLI